MPNSALNQFRAARIDCALQERTIGTQLASSQSHWYAFFLDSGRATAQTLAGDFESTGPALFWGPLDEESRLKVAAGSVGHYLFLSERVLADAIGMVAEATDLRLFADRHMLVSIERADPRVPELETAFERLADEAHHNLFGAEIAVSAYVRLLLITLWRSHDPEGTMGKTTIVQGRRDIYRFRNLVETHFRSRWKARDYAKALDMTYDRLHDLCVRSVGKPPAQLIRERSIHEARVLLQRTTLSAERISSMLGFTSASQFNHFFKAMGGESPGAFRKHAATPDEKAQKDAPRFSDWP